MALPCQRNVVVLLEEELAELVSAVVLRGQVGGRRENMYGAEEDNKVAVVILDRVPSRRICRQQA